MMDERSQSDLGRTVESRSIPLSRRRFLAGAGAAGVGSIAGCLSGPTSDEGDNPAALANFRGSGPLVEQRDPPGGPSISELPDLSGSLNLYIGGGESGLYLELIDQFEKIYSDFEIQSSIDSSSSLANTIIEESEAGTSPADLFLSVDAGSLVAVADAGATESLPDEVTSPAVEDFRTDQWVGVAGRARAMPYNTEMVDESTLPETVQEIPETDAFADAVGWAPTYGAFQAFVTAMRLLRGNDETRQWLEDMQDIGAEAYDNEFFISSAVADGEIRTGFANHYYALRVLNSREDAPIDLHFTSGDAGALINVSGAEIIKGTSNSTLAQNFVRHLLSAEAQEYFATRAFAYPTVPEVSPVGGLPTIAELSPPDIDLTQLSDIQPTLDLLRDTGVL